MISARDAYEIALALMDEGGSGSPAPEPGMAERALKIINALRAEILSLLGGCADYAPLESLDSELRGQSAAFALGALPYGLAAHLLIDEQSAMSAFYHERYAELIHAFAARQKAVSEDVKNLY